MATNDMLRLHGFTAGLAWLWLACGAANCSHADDNRLELTRLPPPSSAKVDFARDVRPILAAHCQSCHGTKKDEGGLRLDRKANALAGGNRGAAIDPGKSAESRLIHFVAGLDPETVMPPEGDRLNREQISLLRAWIDQGAVWPEAFDATEDSQRRTSDHWAFQPIRRTKPPEIRHGSWARNALDRFILGRLEPFGISPSPEADRVTLIRRLSFDLRGLPPTVAEVDAFLADTEPGAYERLVERLLSSPHCGEHWGRHWLDAARYADSDGYNADSARPIWKYRDWVIEAFNRDIPFDQFTIDQLAGDLVPGASDDQKIATGFHRNTLLNLEGGNDPEEYRVERVVDRVNTTGSVFLGLTVGCAECHAHKYDPISQREFYQLFAFFNNADEPLLEFPTPEQAARRTEIRAAIEQVESQLAAYDAESAAKQLAWERRIAAWGQSEVLDPVSFLSAGGATLTERDDHSLAASGTNPRHESLTVVAHTTATGITGICLDILASTSAPQTGLGRSSNGTFALSEFRVQAAPLGEPSQAVPVSLVRGVALTARNETDPNVARALDNDLQTSWTTDPSSGSRSVRVLFETAEKVGFPNGTTWTFRFEHESGTYGSLAGVRLSVVTAPQPAALVSELVQSALVVKPELRTAEQKKLLADEFQKGDPDRRVIAGQIEALKKQEPVVLTTLGMQERAEPRVTRIHLRGSFLRPGGYVTPGVPAVLPPLAKSEHPTRLDLARWLVAAENPLTARVAVNRYWQAFFGAGLVETENDFGTQGTPPTHPELLDWLAEEFRMLGWSGKSLIRLIVCSATYRQASIARPELMEIDPRNQLWSRQTRQRLAAENVRDAMLAASGLLSRKIGGPSVFPYQPEGIMQMRRSVVAWKMSPGDDRYRRGLYTHFWRTSPHPFLMAFDAPKADSSCTRRARSDTPLQALMLLNHAAFVECARGLAYQLLSETARSDAEQIGMAFRICLAREPTQSERERLHELLIQQQAEFAADPVGAAQLCGGEPPPGSSVPRLAAWIAVARVLLNLDEFITRE